MMSSRVPVNYPEYKSCCLYAGCPASNKQVAPALVPKFSRDPSFDIVQSDFDASSTVHFHSSPVFLPDSLYCLLIYRSLPVRFQNSSIHRFVTSSCKAVTGGHTPMKFTVDAWQPFHARARHNRKSEFANPYFIRQLPGRKSDKKDAAWISECLQFKRI